MRFCTGCGTKGTEETGYCPHCGEAPPVQVVTIPSRLVPRKLTWVGSPASALFFLPWITVSCQGGGPAFSLSGYELAGGTIVGDHKVPGETILFVIPIAAILFVAFWLLAGVRHGKGVMWLPIVKIVAAAIPLLILLYKYLDWTGEIRRQGAGLLALHFNGGYLLTVLAFVTAGIGALLEQVD